MKLRKGQQKKFNRALVQRHIASAQRMKNPIVARYAPIVGKALVSLAERGAIQQSQILTTVLDAYEAEIERLTALLEEKDANEL
jgi:DNA topoisomerase VI subunit B